VTAIRSRLWCIALALSVWISLCFISARHSTFRQPSSANSKASNRNKVAAAFDSLPLLFEENRGQAQRDARYVARNGRFDAFFMAGEVKLRLDGPTVAPHRASSHSPKSSRSRWPRTSVVHLVFVNHPHESEPHGVGLLDGKVNYLRSGGRSLRGIPTFGKVQYDAVYPGIDVDYRGHNHDLEYDFIVAPDANPDRIRMAFEGANDIHLGANGDLILETSSGILIERKPIITQGADGDSNSVSSGLTQPVPGGYKIIAGNEVGFTVGPYDHHKRLVIDPVMVYSSEFNPSPSGEGDVSEANGVAVDSAGDAYEVGSTLTLADVNGAAEDCTVGSFVECGDTFIAKLNPSGTALIYDTLISGSAGLAIAVDSAQNVYLAGEAASEFPATANAFQQTEGGGTCGDGTGAGPLPCYDAYVAELDSTGANITYASFLGGSSNDAAYALAIDSSNAIYVTGQAGSNNFPTTTGAYKTSFDSSPGAEAIFVAKIDPTKSGAASLIYSTFLGGSATGEGADTLDEEGGDQGNGIAVDQNGNAYVTGVAFSPDIATNGAFQTVRASSENPFVAKFNPTGSDLLWATYLGGHQPPGCALEFSSAIAVDSSGDSYVTGRTPSADFPTTPGAFQPVFTGTPDVFVTKLNPTGSSLVYSTLLGGSATVLLGPQTPQKCGGGQTSQAIALDQNEDAFVVGSTATIDFPIGQLTLETKDYQPTPDESVNGESLFLDYSAFIAELDPQGKTLPFSTYLSEGSLSGIALDSAGAVYVSGTGSPAYLNVAGIHSTGQVFVQKLVLNTAAPAVSISPQTVAFGPVAAGTTSAPQDFTLSNVGNGPLNISSVVATEDVNESNNCPAALGPGTSCTFTVTDSGQNGTITLTDNAIDSPQVVNVYEGGAEGRMSLSTADLFFPSQTVGITSSPQIVTLSSGGDAPVQLTGIKVTGDFAETSNCGSTVAVATTCQISVTFTPTTAGNRSGTLTISDTSPTIPTLTVALSGVGEPVPFTVTSTSSSATVTAGQTATYTLQVSAPAGFKGGVTASCSGAPTGANCNAPSPITLDGTTVVTEKITVTTTAQSVLGTRGPELNRPGQRPSISPSRLVFMGATFLLVSGSAVLLFLPNRFSRSGVAYLCGVFLIGCVLSAGCGGGNSSGSGSAGTPSGTYTLTVTFAGGGGTKAVPLTLIVQ